jgi:hypothetical protein
MENALLYTFSTIAQTLGGAIALLSAFVLYRFQSLDAAIAKDANELRTRLSASGGSPAEHDRLEAEGNYQQILENVKAQGEHTFSIPAFKRLKHGIDQKKKIVDAFMAAASMTGTGMMLSIVVLPLTQFLINRRAYSFFILLAGVIIFVACIVMYWLVISAALGLRKFRSENT